MKRKSCSFLALFLAFSLISCANDNSHSTNSGSLEPSTSESSSTKPSASGGESTSTSIPAPSISTSTSESISTTKGDVKSAIEKAVTKSSLIASGTVKQSEKNDWGEEVSESSFEFGKDSFHYNGEDYNVKYDMYLLKDTNDSIVAIQKNENGSIKKPYDSFKTMGYPFSGILGYSNSFTGAEELVQGLYTIGESNVNKDFKYQVEDGEYSFSFGYFESLEAWEFLKVNCSFTIGSQSEFNNVNLVVESYSQSSFIVDVELGIIQLNSGAKASTTKTYEIAQVIGERSFVCPIDLKSLKATSFDLVYDGKTLNNGDTIEVSKGDYGIKVSFANIAPETASFVFDVPLVTVSESGLSMGFSSYDNSINGSATEVGEYEVEILTENVRKTFKVNVVQPQPKSISLSYATIGPNDYTAYSLNNNSINGYVGVEYFVVASILPDAASQGVNAVISGVDSSKFELTKKTIELGVGEKEVWSFKAKEAGDFPITFTSATKSEVNEIVNVHAEAAPTFASLLSSGKFGSKSGANLQYEFEFTPTGNGENGSVKIINHLSSQTEVANYSISKEEKCYKFNLTHVSGDSISVELVMGFDFSLMFSENDWYEPLSKITLEFLASRLSFEGDSESQKHSLYINLMADNQASLILDYSDYQDCFFSLAEEGDHYVGSFYGSKSDDSFVEVPLAFTLSKDMETLTISFTFDGEVETFTLSISE